MICAITAGLTLVLFLIAVQHERTPRHPQPHNELSSLMYNIYNNNNNKSQKRKSSESLRSLQSVKIKTKKEPQHSPSSSEEQTDSSLSPYHSPLSMKEIVYESSMRILYVSIQWVKHIPTFKDLPYNDQNLLIHQGWCEVFILGMLSSSLYFPLGKTTLSISTGMSIADDFSNLVCPMFRSIAMESTSGHRCMDYICWMSN